MSAGERAIRRLGAEALRHRLVELSREIPGVRRSSDCEHLHRMRVASRRARSILAIFWDCWPSRRRSTWRREIRRLTRTLGAARDTDVQIFFLRATMDGALPAAARPGLARLLLRKEQARERMQVEVTTLLDELENTGILADLEQYVARAAAVAADAGTDGAAALRERARSALTPLHEALLAHAASVHEPDQTTAHHELRVCVKRLRYALEIFVPLSPNAIGRALKPLKELQRLLGEMHDCDVWLEALPRLAEEERRRTLDYFGSAQPFASLKPGLVTLQERCEVARRQHYAGLVTVWDGLDAAGFWEKLRELPREPRGATLLSAREDSTSGERRELA